MVFFSVVQKMGFFLVVLFLQLLGGRRLSIPSLERDSEAEVSSFRAYYQGEVLPYYRTGQFGSFQGEEGVAIHYGKFPAAVNNTRGAIVMLHGAGESAIKYAELIYDLRDTGFGIYIMDHRGFGNSTRILNDSEQDRRKMYVRDFQHYVADVKTFYDDVVSSDAEHEKLFVWAHSLGGNIATQYIEQYPDDFDGAILSSPLMETTTTHPLVIPEGVGYRTTKILVFLGMGKSYALDMGEPEILVDASSQDNFEKELITTSWKRWTVFTELLVENPQLICGGPGATWGVTNQFAKELYEATFLARSSEEAAKIKIPVIVFQSDQDYIVGTEGIRTLARNAVNAPSFDIVNLPGYHESYMEQDATREQVIARTDVFLNTM